MSQGKRIFFDLARHVEAGKSCLASGQAITLEGDDLHYLRDVVRAKAGDEICLLDRGGNHPPAKAEIESLQKTGTLRIKELIEKIGAREQPVRGLAFALCKGERNDLVAQKLTELGLARIVFWQADRSIVRLDVKGAANRLERLRRIVEGAAEQSGQHSVPEVFLCGSLAEALAALRDGAPAESRYLCCSLSPDARPLHECITDHAALHLVIGPEGDLSPEEENALVAASFDLVNLGPSVLRSETAAIVAAAMSQALWRAR